ncbi:TlpA disulfide reductase family protein [Flavobacterium jumunjinense]
MLYQENLIMNKIAILFLSFISTITFSQTNISGKILLKDIKSDTLKFFSGTLSNDYYENPSIIVPIKNNEFKIKEAFSYPQLYVHQLKSISDSIFFRVGFLFLDNSTTKLSIDKNLTPTEHDGITQKEFRDIFIPFITNNDEDLKKHFFRYTRSESIDFDERLLKYVEKHPDSYIALWFIAQRNKITGNNVIHKKIMNLFSNEVKKSKLWKSLNANISTITIFLDKPFPRLTLKNRELIDFKLEIKKNKFTLIDFWFSSCKPCIAIMPEIKSLYEKYKDKGFNVISISTDKEKHIDLWKKQRHELDMNWENYLDLNGEIAKQNSISMFPTLFLIDENGVLIKKDMDLNELEKFLKQNLKQQH